jgi:hypothetical protein
VETADAAIMEPSERIEKLIEMKQYVPNMDDRYFMRSIECVRPKFFDPKQMEMINTSIMFEEKAKALQMEMQLKQLILQNTQLDMQLQQIQQQMGQPGQEAGQPQSTQPSAPETPPQSMMAGQPPASIPSESGGGPTGPPPIPNPEAGTPQSAPPVELEQGDGTINWEEVVQTSASTISKIQGIPPQQAMEMVKMVVSQIRQDMPGSPDTAIASEFVKRMKKNLG